MEKIKSIYVILGLIVFTAMGTLAIIPELIPSWVWVQQIVILLLYLLNIVFVYVIITRLWNYLKTSYSRKTSLLATSIVTFIVISGLLVAFVVTTLGIGQGFMGGSLAKELKYPEHKIKLFLYDESFLDARTTLKVKHKFWPTMKDLAFIENCHPKELDIIKYGDTLKIVAHNTILKVNLVNRKVEKVVLDQKKDD